jgi:hypothetical protein
MIAAGFLLFLVSDNDEKDNFAARLISDRTII